MLTPYLRDKFSDLYTNYGLGATKNMLLIVQLLLLGRTTSLWRLKDYAGLVLACPEVQPESHYRRIIRFFDEWAENENFRLDLQRRALRLLKKLRFTHLLLDGTVIGLALPATLKRPGKKNGRYKTSAPVSSTNFGICVQAK